MLGEGRCAWACGSKGFLFTQASALGSEVRGSWWEGHGKGLFATGEQIETEDGMAKTPV